MNATMADPFEMDVRAAIGGAFPGLAEEELISATEAFLAYIDLVNDICDGLANDPERSATATTLTARPQQGTVETGQAELINQELPINA